MLLDFVELARDNAEPLYGQLAAALRVAVTQGWVLPGTKLPSIRRAAAELNISRITVEAAYQQLCLAGYVESRPQSGYFVRDSVPRPAPPLIAASLEAAPPRFDFRSGRVDAASADLHIWQKQMRAALIRQDELVAYGDPQGEYGLRKALAAYGFTARGLSATAQNIVIGAGVQPLLILLCSLLKQCPTLPALPSVAMESPGFAQAEQVFADFDLPMRRLPEQPPLWQRGLADLGADIYCYLPSRRAAESFAPEAARRDMLLQWLAACPGRYIIEDDYNGELRYQSRPLPALQCLARESIIYLGSFSKLLLPSIRVAYMVLPPALAYIYQQKAPAYNQTAGKIEQMALQTYIEQGLLEKHLRRLRKLYLKKSQVLRRALVEAFGASCELVLWETDLSYLITLDCRLSAEELTAQARAGGVAVRAAGASDKGRPRLLLNFAGIASADIEPAVAALAAAVEIAGNCHVDML